MKKTVFIHISETLTQSSAAAVSGCASLLLAGSFSALLTPLNTSTQIWINALKLASDRL